MVAPKGSGTSVRRNFDGSGINSSFAASGCNRRAMDERSLWASPSVGFLFPTTFQMEVYSDLTGERGVLMGALAGMMEAQYAELRRHGHTPSEAFNETVEELTQSPHSPSSVKTAWTGCTPTARRRRRGAFDWRHKFRKAVEPVSRSFITVAAGRETEIVLRVNSARTTRRSLTRNSRKCATRNVAGGAAVRSLRPEKRKK